MTDEFTFALRWEIFRIGHLNSPKFPCCVNVMNNTTRKKNNVGIRSLIGLILETLFREEEGVASCCRKEKNQKLTLICYSTFCFFSSIIWYFHSQESSFLSLSLTRSFSNDLRRFHNFRKPVSDRLAPPSNKDRIVHKCESFFSSFSYALLVQPF